MTEVAGKQAVDAAPTLRRVGATDGPPLLEGRMLLKVGADESREAYTLCVGHTPAGVGPPLHLHAFDDQTHYVVRGTYELIVGPDVVAAGPGAAVHMPRFTPHTFRNMSNEPAEIVELTAPGGIDRYFVAVAHLGPVAMDLEARNEIGRPFGMSFPEDPEAYLEPPPGEARRAATFVLDGEGQQLGWDGCDALLKIGMDDTAGSHSLTEVFLPAGSSVTLPDAEQHAIVVLSGEVLVHANGERATAGAGDTVAALPAQAVTVEAGGEPGKLVVYTFTEG